MDDTDARLLQLLERDARASATALAAALGLSRSAVADRLRRLQAEGAIRRFTIERGDAAADPASLSRLGDRLARVPGVAAVTSYPVLRRY